ncbi:MAG: hypothetical protein IJV99_04220 [Clostridia bacterium]|nr:hypothetical protein [Clostridia bacterium]
MIKIIDIDSLFDKYIEGYVYANIGKVKPEEIENKIPELYLEFGDKELKELGGKTPNTFYKQFSGEQLVECLKTHVEQGIAVSDFLCEAITGNPENQTALANALSDDKNEEFLLYIMNMLGETGSKLGVNRYLEFIAWDYGETVRELATELLSEMAEEVKEQVIERYKDAEESKKPYYTEILSKTVGDDRVFDILVAEFAKHKENLPLYANYLAKFGDERALPFLLNAIEDQSISYADFEELRFAIEALGGSYDKKRDFTSDKTYKKIKGIKKK